jgi:ATP-dependent helicase/nuclease subunit A
VTSHSPSLQRFVSFVRQTGGSQKREIDSSDNRVRIMTVHGAKGLEAPIVFLADAGKKPPSTARLSQKILLTRNHVPVCIKVSPVTELMREEKKFLNQSEIREYRRLLYVAVTRAKDWLFVGGYLPKRQGSAKEKTEEEITSKKESSKTWYDYIVDGMIMLDGYDVIADTLGTSQKTYLYTDKNIGSRDIVYQASSIPQSFQKNILASIENTPSWLSQPIVQIKTEQSLILSPSKALKDETIGIYDEQARQKGIMTHKLLEIIPFLKDDQRDQAIDNILKNFSVSVTIKESVIRQLLNLIKHPDYQIIFSEGGLSEVPVIGTLPELDNQTISGQIDRMVVLEKEVMIVDYKSDKNLDSNFIPKKYIVQMALYQAALQRIYTDKLVRCFILNTSSAEIIELSQDSMRASLQTHTKKAVA